MQERWTRKGLVVTVKKMKKEPKTRIGVGEATRKKLLDDEGKETGMSNFVNDLVMMVNDEAKMRYMVV
ncbi:hypothetical protein KM043_018226 [Ampulex compressa]|nr:hypothetical protein KM043_018226 [Ampulex compressa]